MTLRKDAFSAGRWTTASVLFRALVQFIQTAVLARLLAPSDFGLMAMSGTAVALASLFSELGLNSALIHFPLPSKAVRSALYLLNVTLGLALAALIALLAHPVAALYGNAELVPILSLLGLAFPLNAAGQQFRALAEKDLRFPILAKIEAASALLSFSIAIAAALAGAGVYALVAGVLANAAINSMLTGTFLGELPVVVGRGDWRSTRRFLAYGGHRVGEQVWNTMLQQLDVIIASLSATPGAVALYATPRNQSLSLANTVVNPIITRVGLPIMARLQDDPAAVREVYLKTMRFTASINFPVYALVALFPAEIVALFLGSQWSGAVPYLRIFAIWGLIRSTGNPSGSLLYAVGMVKRAHAWNFLSLLASAPALWLAEQRWGLPGLAWSMLALQSIVFVAAWRFLILPACGASFREYFGALLPALSATTLAAGVGYLFSLLVPGAGWLGALAGGGGGVLAYLLGSYVFNRSWLAAMGELLRPLSKWAP